MATCGSDETIFSGASPVEVYVESAMQLQALPQEVQGMFL